MADPRELVLASASPRRRELLAGLGVRFRVVPSPVEEPSSKPVGQTPAAWAEYLAQFKAEHVAALYPQALVLGADTLVVCEGEILGKPVNRQDAARMLQLQAGRPGEVITGVCLTCKADSTSFTRFHERTRVWMRDDPVAIAEYLAGDDWRDKAGAYGIQNVGDRLIARIEGSFSNVVGLPVDRLAEMLLISLNSRHWSATSRRPSVGK